VSILDLLFPRHCLGCGKTGLYFCSDCTARIKKVSQICPVCEKPSPFGQTHRFCETKYSLAGLISLFPYEGIVRNAIHKLKYKLVTDLETELWQVIKNTLEEKKQELTIFNQFLADKPTVVPIPLYWYKENLRGFNQSSLLGKRLAKFFDLPFSDKILVRQKNVISQTKLAFKERKENVKGIFRALPQIQNSLPNILLVDDVWTTGSTLKEAARTLKDAGAKTVWGLTLAR